jgi:hypothetical protein
MNRSMPAANRSEQPNRLAAIVNLSDGRLRRLGYQPGRSRPAEVVVEGLLRSP